MTTHETARAAQAALDVPAAPRRDEHGAAFRRALIVANPVAGRGQGAKVAREIAQGLARQGTQSCVHVTAGRGDGRARVRCLEQDIDLVVSVGGDGTLREVFDGLVDPRVPVAVLPAGTANVLGIDLGLPRDVDGLLELVRARRIQAIDVADVNGHLSFLVTGVGFDGRVAREVENRRRGPITKWSYVPAVLRSLRDYRPPRLKVELDGALLPGEFGWVLASNIVHYGGFLELRGHGALDDGLWEIYLFADASPWGLARAGARGVLASLPGGKSCTMRRARSLRVTCDEPVPYQVDGDARGSTPVELALNGRRHVILIPGPLP
jgi:diacylglycerol kinase (ATP)